MLNFDISWLYPEYNEIANITSGLKKAIELCNSTCLASLIMISIVFAIHIYFSPNFVRLIVRLIFYFITYAGIGKLVTLVVILFSGPISWLYQHFSNPHILISFFISILLTLSLHILFSNISKFYKWFENKIFIH